jgi:hypothetical protein
MPDFTANLRIIGHDAFYVWRCSKCGKWSHAKKKPTHHLVADYDEFENHGYNHCGPFEEWYAERRWMPNMHDHAVWLAEHGEKGNSA